LGNSTPLSLPVPNVIRTACVTGIALLGFFVGVTGCGEAPEPDPDPSSAESEELLESARNMFGVLESVPEEAVRDSRVVLGRELFWDERLSSDGRTACASCHTREAWGADARRRAPDARGERTQRQSQTVFNATLQPALRWLADRDDAANQAFGSITGSMGLDDPGELTPLLLEHGYEEAFHQAFPDGSRPVSPENYARALQAYQATLVTPASFDDYLQGDRDALTQEQKEGLRTFQATGCASCHSGELLGGSALQRFGMVEDYWEATGSEEVDEGRYAMTGEEEDRYVFRTPMLRNVARTGPYFHDGSVDTLEDAVRIMARVQLGRTLSDSEVEQVLAFLESLTGEVPAHYAPPEE